MRSIGRRSTVVGAVLVVLGLASMSWATGNASAGNSLIFEGSDGIARRKTIALLDASPAVFVENAGQCRDDSARFIHCGKGANVYLTDDGIAFQFLSREGEKASSRAVRATFPGARVTRPEGLGVSKARFNYYDGDNPRDWGLSAAAFEQVIYRDLYPGIDLIVHGKRSHVKYEFVVSRGDPKLIRVAFDGIDKLSITPDGRLRIQTALGEFVEDAPVIYQEKDGVRLPLTGGFRLIDERSYTVDITSTYDAGLPLVIDPDLKWSTYLGGSSFDMGQAIAVNEAGDVYVTGYTWSSNFPTLHGRDTTYPGGLCAAYVSKFDSNGSLVWSTFLGGSLFDVGLGVAADATGNVYVTGRTLSADFPTTLNGWDTTYNGNGDVFLTKFNADGSLLWSTFLGGSEADIGYGVAVDGSGNVYVTGETDSDDFPLLQAWDSSFNEGGSDAFVAKFDTNGSLVWSTYLGGSGSDNGNGIALDGSGNVHVTGVTGSSDFPHLNGLYQTYGGGGSDAFLAMFNNNGTLIRSTYLGGSGGDNGNGVAADQVGNVYVVGDTGSANFPHLNAIKSTCGGTSDAFVARFAPGGRLFWCTYLGGGDADHGTSIALDNDGNIYVAGYTSSTDFPVKDAWDASSNGNQDAFVAKFSSASPLLWSTYLGGSNSDMAYGVAAHAPGYACVTGCAWDNDFPTVNAWNDNFGGGCDVFVSKFGPSLRALDVQSEPITGLTITGTPSGVTNYSVQCIDDMDVVLTAPLTVSSGGTRYALSRWILNNVSQGWGRPKLSFNIKTASVARAIYRPVCELAVNAAPIAGVSVTGTSGGTTPYVSQVDSSTLVTLNVAAAAAGDYAFVNWNLNGSDKTFGNTALSFTITADSTATARYKQIGYLTISGPKSVKESSRAKYSCKLYCKDGTSYAITPYVKWGENSSCTKFTSPGVLKTSAVPHSMRGIRLSGQYAGKTCYYYITVVNVP